MFPNRIRVPGSLTEALKQLKGKTGVTPNILCRIALIVSLRDGRKGTYNDQELDGLEFNASTLFGEHAEFYECIFRQVYGKLEPERVEQLIAQHIVDGLTFVRATRSITELADVH